MTKKKFGETFLTKTRRISHSAAYVEKSFYVWRKQGKYYRLSYLGIINGFLHKVGLVLVLDIVEGYIVKTKIKRKWWE